MTALPRSRTLRTTNGAHHTSCAEDDDEFHADDEAAEAMHNL